jgi:hypothetical protein
MGSVVLTCPALTWTIKSSRLSSLTSGAVKSGFLKTKNITTTSNISKAIFLKLLFKYKTLLFYLALKHFKKQYFLKTVSILYIILIK